MKIVDNLLLRSLVRDFGVEKEILSCLYLDFVITGKRDDIFILFSLHKVVSSYLSSMIISYIIIYHI